uniref:UspA domain-containing protein n=1 Tax=Quercus lobata TaxID=97700 RepID=A0A7N2L5D7_QUELO
MADLAAKERKILVAVDEGEESLPQSRGPQKPTARKFQNTSSSAKVKPPRPVFSALDGQVKVETRIEHGDPRDVICQMTERLGADMLVMGSHGYGLVKRALLGSVSNHCAQNVKCPVLIVKKPKSTATNN